MPWVVGLGGPCEVWAGPPNQSTRQLVKFITRCRTRQDHAMPFGQTLLSDHLAATGRAMLLVDPPDAPRPQKVATPMRTPTDERHPANHTPDSWPTPPRQAAAPNRSPA